MAAEFESFPQRILTIRDMCELLVRSTVHLRRIMIKVVSKRKYSTREKKPIVKKSFLGCPERSLSFTPVSPLLKHLNQYSYVLMAFSEVSPKNESNECRK